MQSEQKVIETVYMTPNSSLEDIRLFLSKKPSTLPSISKYPELAEYQKMPIVLSGDYNINIRGETHSDFLEFMQQS